MSNGSPSRAAHFRAALRRQLRGRTKDTTAVVGLIALAIIVTLGIIAGQKASLPSWMPFVGQDFVHYKAEFSTAQAVTPGQGQAVTVSGIQVGKVGSVELKDGKAVVGLEVEPKYADLFHPTTHLLLRPKTNLNDMVVEANPGPGSKPLPDGSTIPLSQTEPNVNFDAFLSTLDGDTRQYIQLLVAAGSRGLGSPGQARTLSATFRRFGPFSLYLSQLNHALAGRRQALARVIHDFGRLTEELGRRDTQIRRFVDSSSKALGAFASRQESIQLALKELPSTLRVLQAGAGSANKLSIAARPTLTALIPQAQAFAPALRASQRFFSQTLSPLRDQIRPFTRQVRAPLNHAAQAAAPLAKSVKGFGNGIGALNYGLNELAYDPPGKKQGYLFYLPWLNHDLNATYPTQDAGGPLRRSILLLSCNTMHLAEGLASQRPELRTLLQATNVPHFADHCSLTPPAPSGK